MPFSYLGNFPNQQLKNSGIFSPEDVLNLSAVGEYGGSLELVSEVDVSSASSHIFTEIAETKYSTHFLTFQNYVPSTNSTQLILRFYESGVEESASVYQFIYNYIDTGFAISQATAIDYLRMSYSSGNGTGETSCGHAFLYGLGNSSSFSFQTMEHIQNPSSTNFRAVFGSGCLPQASVVDQIKVFVTSGTYSATLRLYGLKDIV